MSKPLSEILDVDRYPIGSDKFLARSKRALDENGVLMLPDFVMPAALASILSDAETHQNRAYYTNSSHNIYLTPPDPDYPDDHPRNRDVCSSKGCITTDQIPADSVLHTLYGAAEFREFLCAILDETRLHAYADKMSSINIHYASAGQELGWHFDNSSFAITLMIQNAKRGGVFEYVKDVRDADQGDMNYLQCKNILDGKTSVQTLTMEPGTLVLFRGRNSMHRVTPVKGEQTRMLVVLAYNTEPGIALSESARTTFYGRLE